MSLGALTFAAAGSAAAPGATTEALTSSAALLAALPEPVSMVLVFGLLGLLPFAFMGLTAFVKISTVLHLVRSAIGAQSIPSTAILLVLSASLTLLAMAPVGSRIADRATPLLATSGLAGSSERGAELAVSLLPAVIEPMRDFLGANASEKEKERFLTLARTNHGSGAAAVETKDLVVLIPSFLTTELTEAFSLGFALFLPFLIVDLLVGNILLALGMQAVSPLQLSLPFKLLLFVAVDGWGLLSSALVSGYATG